MRSRRTLANAAALAGSLAFSLAACRGTEIEDALGKVSWFSNMRDQVAVEPYEQLPLTPPEGTVPAGAGVALMGLPDDYQDIANPVPATAESLERGKESYDILCSVCHGPEGRGGGSIEGPYPRGLINPVVSERARGLSDGYLFGIIAVGRGLMPNYRRLPQQDRWHIVNYVRELQRLAPPEGQ